MSEKEKQEEASNYDKEAYVRYLCEGLNGKGCGTSLEYVSSHRKEKSWEEKCLDFQKHQGD